MKLRTTLALLISGLTLGGCASGPQPGDITTGSILPALPALPSVSGLMPTLSGPGSGPKPAEHVSGNLYRVLPDERRFDDSVKRENYALLRSAEAAQWAGGTHFIIVNATAQAGPGGSNAPGTLIRVLRLESGSEPPIGAVAADEIVHFFGSSFGRSTAQDATPPAGKPG